MLTDLFIRIASAALKVNVREHILPEVDVDDHTFACKDLSMMSMIYVGGLMSTPGKEEVTRIEDAVKNLMTTNLTGRRHSMSWHFLNDPDGTSRVLDHAFSPARHAAKVLDIDIHDIIDENIHFISDGEHGCVHEAGYLCLWTHRGAVPDDEMTHFTKNAAADQAKCPVVFDHSANPFAVSDSVHHRHSAFVNQAVYDLGAAGLHVRLMERHEAMQALRFALDRTVSLDWQPALSGDPVPPRERLPGVPDADASDLLNPPLSWQVGRSPIEPVSEAPYFVRVGELVYAPVVVDTFPYEIHRFHYLFSRIPRDIPWSMAVHVGGDDDSFLATRKMFSAFSAFLSPDNKVLRKEYQLIDEDLRGDGDVRHHRCRVQMLFLTWADSIDLLRKRLTRLTQAIESWGNPSVLVDNAAPSESLISAAPGATYYSTATPAYGRAEDITRFLPLSRPASPWEQGALVFTTPDRKPYPYQPCSSLQTVHIDIIFAKPGNGKSVLSNAVNTALILRGGLDELPDISIMDIGRSSGGQANLIKHRLPESRKHEVFAKRLRMHADDAYNILDTELGARFPLPMHREFVRDFLSLLMSAPGEEAPHPEISRLIPLAIDKTYEALSDTERGYPRTYTRGVVPEVDSLVEILHERNKIILDSNTTWWEVVDAIFEAGKPELAILAQRIAVPTLADMVHVVANNDAIQSQYGEKSGLTMGGGSGEPVATAFARILSAALGELPILGNHTRLDLSRAYIKSIDLQDIAPKGSEAAKRQTGLMYLMAIQASTGHYFLDVDYLDYFPTQYREYHQRRFTSIRRRPKRIVCDELHMAPPAILQLLERYGRVIRKYNISLALISQQLSHFPKDLLEMSTTRFILGQLEPSEIAEVKKAFNLTETDIRILSSNMVHGPRPGIGSAFLMSFVIKENTYSQVVRMRKGPRELWSYSTTTEDNEVQNIVYEALGPVHGLNALQQAYPNATILPEYERRRRQLSDDEDFVSEAVRTNILDEIANEIITAYQQQNAA